MMKRYSRYARPDAVSRCYTIITICYNDHAGLCETLASVKRQRFDDYEHLVIDGGSTDGSVEMLRQWSDGDRYWFLSEPDAGISDAFNKGIAASRGQFLCFLNAGDQFADLQLLADLRDRLPPGGVLAGRSSFGQRMIPKVAPYPGMPLPRRSMISHQAAFAARSLFESIGCYAIDLKLRMDFDWWLRALRRGPLVFDDRVWVTYREGGVSGAKPWLFYCEELRVLRRQVAGWPIWWLDSTARLAVRSLRDWLRSVRS